MALHRVNRIIILRVNPGSIILRKDLHNAVTTSMNLSKKQPSIVSQRKDKPNTGYKRNQQAPHPLDFSAKKTLTSYVPEPINHFRNLMGNNMVDDFKRGIYNLALLNFDKCKGVTNKIKSDLLSVDNVVRELICVKPNEFHTDTLNFNKHYDDDDDDDLPKDKKKTRYPSKRYDNKSEGFDNFDKYEKYEKDPRSYENQYKKKSNRFDEIKDVAFNKYAEDDSINKNTYRYSKYDDYEVDDNTNYRKEKYRNYNKLEKKSKADLVELEEDSVEYVPKKHNRRLQREQVNYDDELIESTNNNFTVNLLPVDDNIRELISFKPHEKVTVEELSEVNALGGKAIPVETLLKNRIRPYKPSYQKNSDKKQRKSQSFDQVEALERSGNEEHYNVKNKRNRSSFKKYEKNPEKIAKFKKFEEFEEINEDEMENNNKRILRRKTEDSLYYPSYEEYEKANKYWYKDTSE